MGGQITGWKAWEDAVQKKENAQIVGQQKEAKQKKEAEQRFKADLIRQLQGINENLDAIRSAIERNGAPAVITSEQLANLQSIQRANR